MTLHTHAGSIPTHQYVWVEPGALGDHDWIRGVWFGITAWPGRAWGCHVMLECGAVYRNVGLHQIASHVDAEDWTPEQAATWNAYGFQFSTLEYPYLAGLNCRTRLQDKTERKGRYLFTAAPVGDAYSSSPEQSKEFYFLVLNNNRYTAQPTNQILFTDKSFTIPSEWPRYLKRQDKWFDSEGV